MPEQPGLSPFDFLASVTHSKKDLFEEDRDAADKAYNSWIVNRGLSMHEDTVLFANEMNRRWGMFREGQYRYYLGSLRPRKRFGKWAKAEKDESLDLIQKTLGCNRTVAKQHLRVLDEAGVKRLAETQVVGGKK